MLKIRAGLAPLAVLLVLAGALALSPGATAKPKGFSFGVATGDVSAKSAIFWGRANKQGKTRIQITGRKHNFRKCKFNKSAGSHIVEAKNSNDLTVQKRVYKLRPNTKYKYRFCMTNGRRSTLGKFKTAPKQGQQQKIRFALAGDQDARPVPGGSHPYWNHFQVWQRIKEQNNDFNVLMGDTIYSDTEVPGYTLDDVAVSVKEKWAAYKTNLSNNRWQNARGSASYYAHWDDHEFLNDFSPEEDVYPYSNHGVPQGSTNINGEQLYKQGVRAYTDYNPLTYSEDNGIYRSQRWGKNLEVFFLDERSFRSASADYSGVCDNPSGSGDPDLAPTAPQGTRNVFAALIPTLANPVSQACLDKINDPNRTMLGSRQLSQFKKAVKNSGATFKVIFNEVPIQQYYALPYDRWEGYESERKALLHYLEDNVKNAIFLTTDVHASLVNVARYNTLGPDGVQDSNMLDVTSGPVATENYNGEINTATGSDSAGPLIQSVFLKSPPPVGVGMQCAATDQFGYAQVEVTKQKMVIDLLDDKDQAVLDTGNVEGNPDAPPCSKLVVGAE